MNATVIQRFKFDIILGCSHDMDAFVFAHVTWESGNCCLPFPHSWKATRTNADVTTNIGIQEVDTQK